MPQKKDMFSKGNLLIKFDVEFPAKNFAKEEALKQLAKLLPAPSAVEIGRPPEGSEEVTEEVALHEFDPDTLNAGGSGSGSGSGSGRAKRGEAYDQESDDDEASAHVGRAPQCVSQ